MEDNCNFIRSGKTNNLKWVEDIDLRVLIFLEVYFLYLFIQNKFE